MRFIFIFAFLLFVSNAFSQIKTETIYYKADWTETKYKVQMYKYAIKEYDSTGRALTTYYSKDSTLLGRQYEINDLREGLSIWYHKNGKIREQGFYKNDMATGEFELYNDSGELIRLKTYEEDLLVKRIILNPITLDTLEIMEGNEHFPNKEAEFPGGSRGMQVWISNNVVYPQESIKMNEQGKVHLSFIVEKDGSITNIEVIESVSPSLDKEAKRLLRSMPKWIPGLNEGELSRTKCSIPINFKLTDGREKKKKKRR